MGHPRAWTGFGKLPRVRDTRSGTAEKIRFVVQKEVVRSIINCATTSSSLISIRISAKPYNITVIQVYAPASDHEHEQVREFYEQLDSIIAKTPKKDILVAQSNWNVKVGPDT